MTITVDAVYENGVLRPTEPLPLKELDRVQITIHDRAGVPPADKAAQRGYGLLRWSGSLEDLDHLIEDAENDPLEGS
ncbi:MAG TPA: antitoxin family protein [Gemmataceae bacterium]|nr:antitoxin family protein [Gemmataceae bacterium]